MRRSGRILAGALRAMASAVRPGIPTIVLDRVGEDYIRSHGATPSFKGYRPRGADTPFPAAVCVSVNDVVVHGIPSEDVVLAEGDLVGIDVGVCLDECHTDAALTVPVGDVKGPLAKLMAATRQALGDAVEAAREGNRVRDISSAIQKAVEGGTTGSKTGMMCIRDLAGHGVGAAIHEGPSIPNYVHRGEGKLTLSEGMTLAIEPMTTMGSPYTKRCPVDNWGARTVDGKWSAHYEHTVLVTKTGGDVLTAPAS
ncbi:MAG: type I methionyl aminopeptidase [Armatimonadia bacterium]|nr:type I methionyl aminopeptidase [Armatimonadia bacterium]